MAALLLTIVLSAYSCKSQKAITETLHIRTENEIIRDTVITIQPDSAVLEAMLMCDSNNQVLLRQLKVYEGKRLSYDVTTDSTNRALQLKVVCQEDSIRKKVQVKDKLIQDSTKVTTTEYVEVEKPMSAWNHFLIGCGTESILTTKKGEKNMDKATTDLIRSIQERPFSSDKVAPLEKDGYMTVTLPAHEEARDFLVVSDIARPEAIVVKGEPVTGDWMVMRLRRITESHIVMKMPGGIYFDDEYRETATDVKYPEYAEMYEMDWFWTGTAWVVVSHNAIWRDVARMTPLFEDLEQLQPNDNTVESILGLLQGDERYKAHVYGVFVPDSNGKMYDNPGYDPQVRRVGAPELHRTLPVQSQMEGGVLTDEGVFTPFDNQDDWTQATQARDGSEGQVMVKLPEYWRNIIDTEDGQYWLISDVEIEGFERVPEMFTAADEGVVDRKEGKLCSIVNDDPRYRGGGNQSEWDGTKTSMLGRPGTDLDDDTLRDMARRRGKGWEKINLYDRQTLLMFITIEFATRNTQIAVDMGRTAEGYRKGGIGRASYVDSYFVNNYPIIPCGQSDLVGSNTDEIIYKAPYSMESEETQYIFIGRYRGVANLVDFLYKSSDGYFLRVVSRDEDIIRKCEIYRTSNNSDWGDMNYEDETKHERVCALDFSSFEMSEEFIIKLPIVVSRMSKNGLIPMGLCSLEDMLGKDAMNKVEYEIVESGDYFIRSAYFSDSADFILTPPSDSDTIPISLFYVSDNYSPIPTLIGIFSMSANGSMARECTTSRLCYCKEFADVPTPEPYSSLEVTATKSGEGAADGAVYGTGYYQTGDNVTLRAVCEDEGYEFKKWIRNGSDVTTNPLVITNIQTDETIEAVFGETESPAEG